MSRYASSKYRILLLLGLLVASIFLAVPTHAQSTGGVTTPATPQAPGLFTLIISNLDAVFFTIMLLSIVGLTLILQGFIKNRESVVMPIVATNQIRELIAARRFGDLLEFTENDPSFVSKAINAALKRVPKFENMKEGMETAIGELTAEQFRRIEYLNIIGNLGPLLGLLGTVLGMIKAFSVMMASGGNARPDQLAGGISTALCHTFLGLALAVPCLAAFGVLRTIVDRLTIRAALLSEELLLLLKPASQPAGPPTAAANAGVVPARATPQPAGPRRPNPAPFPAEDAS